MTMLYEPSEVPSAKSGSRFALDRGPGGASAASQAANIAACYSTLLARLVEQSEPLPPTSKTVALKKVVLTDNGYVLTDRQSVTATPTRANKTPGRFVALTSSGPGLVDELMLGSGEGFEKARDDQLWEGLRNLCESTSPSGEVTRSLSIAVALALLLRAGIVMNAAQLP